MTNQTNQIAATYYDNEMSVLAEQKKVPEGTTSQKIRALSAKGMERKDIAKLLNIRYQHVRNVLTTPLKRAA